MAAIPRFGATGQHRQDGTDETDPRATIVRNSADAKIDYEIFVVTRRAGALVTMAVTRSRADLVRIVRAARDTAIE